MELGSRDLGLVLQGLRFRRVLGFAGKGIPHQLMVRLEDLPCRAKAKKKYVSSCLAEFSSVSGDGGEGDFNGFMKRAVRLPRFIRANFCYLFAHIYIYIYIHINGHNPPRSTEPLKTP